MARQENGQERLPVRREVFAPGTVGEIDFQLILAGAACESFTSKGKMCGKPAIRVLDFDISTGTEQLPICSEKCEGVARERIIADEAKRGKVPALGINGWGRH
jgi:hypothetical protein